MRERSDALGLGEDVREQCVQSTRVVERQLERHPSRTIRAGVDHVEQERVLLVELDRVVVRDGHAFDVPPPAVRLEPPLHRHGAGDHRAHRSADRRRQELEDPAPSVTRLLGPEVRGAVVVEEAVSGPLVAMELVLLPERDEGRLERIDLLG